jgi:hypothetical protein
MPQKCPIHNRPPLSLVLHHSLGSSRVSQEPSTEPSKELSTADKRRPRRGLLLALGTIALTGACLGCCVLSVIVYQSVSPGVVSGPSVHVCAGLVTTPRLQIGAFWCSPLSSYRPPLAQSPYAICLNIPLSRMPRGLCREWMFPP